MRVVSLVPSATELLCAIPGGEGLLVGRSHDCDHPETLTHVPTLTASRTPTSGCGSIDAHVRQQLDAGESLYSLDADALRTLQPEVILTQDLCSVCSIDLDAVRTVASTLASAPHVVSLNPMALEDVFDDLIAIGDAVGLAEPARQTMIRLRERYENARDHTNPYADGPEVAFLEWLDPIFVGGHWTPQLIENAGGRHSLNPPHAPSRRVEPSELLDAEPDRVVICPCGFNLNQTRAEVENIAANPWWAELITRGSDNIVLVDGSQMFNRPGPRLVDAFCWLVGWINNMPELIPAGFPCEPLSDSLPVNRRTSTTSRG